MYLEDDNNDEKNINNNSEDIEVVLGDNSILEISAVGDMMNDLRPKDSVNNRKQVIIPQAKKKVVPKDAKSAETSDKKEENKENNNNENENK